MKYFGVTWRNDTEGPLLADLRGPMSERDLKLFLEGDNAYIVRLTSKGIEYCLKGTYDFDLDEMVWEDLRPTLMVRDMNDVLRYREEISPKIAEHGQFIFTGMAFRDETKELFSVKYPFNIREAELRLTQALKGD